MNAPCSTELLESALAGNLAAEDETSLERHLESCDQCNAALEHMAGGRAWRQEVAALLTRDELDAAAPTCDEWSAIDFTVEHLEPADDPNVLGRLGDYDVLEIIGRGGMGVVLKGFDRELKRLVAIKVLATHLAQSALAKKRFAREAQAAAAVVHPNVLAIHQVQAGGRLPFLVMPLVAGESLAERLTAQGRLELKETLRIGMQAAAGLAAAHEQGLVHRDVKPANILLEKGVERAVLTDFGLARAADDATLTRWGVIAGTPQYMSPEQARGEPLDGRSDLFSLGCVLYEMATGVSPFRADSMIATLRRLVDDPPQAISALNAELPRWFIGIVERLLEKDPGRRFGSAREVSELLERCLAHVQQPAAVPLPPGLLERQPTKFRRPPVIKWLAGAAFGFFMIACGILIVLDWKKGTLTIASGDDAMPATVKRVVEGEAGRSKAAATPRDPDHIVPDFNLLSDAVRDFNLRHHEQATAANVTPLTDDEVIAAVRWSASVDPVDGFSAGQLQQLRDIALQRKLAPGWQLELATGFMVPGGNSLAKWSIGLVPKRPKQWQGYFVFTIRDQFLGQLDANKQPVELGEVGATSDGDARPLAAAINGFNQQWHALGGVEMPPLTEREVVAAIRWQKVHREKLDVSNRDFAALEQIAETRMLPAGAEIEVITNFQPGDGNDYLIWSVRLSLARTVNTTPYPRYDIMLRNQFVRSEASDGGKVAWGPVADNGFQAGVRLDPQNEQYVAGQQVTPRFFFRSTSDRTTEASFPNLMTHGYWEAITVVDAAGMPIAIDQDEGPGGPVGWMETAFGFGAEHEIKGMPITLGDVPRDDADAVIRATPGQSVRLRFTLSNYAEEGGTPVQTGDVEFSMSDVKAKQKAAAPRPVKKAGGAWHSPPGSKGWRYR